MLTEIAVKTGWQVEFSDWMQRRGWSSLTVRSYEQDLRVFQQFYALQNTSPFDPVNLTSWDVAAFRRYSLEVEKVKPATWNQRRSFLAALAKWAQERGLISTDPLRGALAAVSMPQAPRWLEKQDFSRLMRQVEIAQNMANTQQRRERAVRDGALVALMVFAGLRVAEVSALCQADIEINERSGKVRVRLGKREKYREVPLCKEARQALSAWLSIQPQDPERFLFLGITTRAIQKRIAEICRSAGIDEISPHRLRHTCAKRMLDAGRPLTEVQMILGHSSLNTTARYVTPGWEDLQAAVDSVAIGKRS